MDQQHGDTEIVPERAASLAMQRRTFLRALAAFGGTAVLAACGGGAPEAPQQSAAATTVPEAPQQSAATTAPAAPVATSGSDASSAGQPTTAPSTTDAAPTAATSAGGTPKQGGVYRLLTNEQFGTLDVARAFNYIDWWLAYMCLYNRLYSFDANGQIFPDLAAELPQVSSDGLKYTVKLRQGVKFHNGAEMTADDVKFSFDRNMWKETEGAGVVYLNNLVGYEEAESGATRDLTGVKVIDPSTVEFTLKQPQAVFPGVLAVGTFGIIPRQAVADAGADWGTNVLIGTGPFKLDQWTANEAVSFNRNPDYFRSGRPYLDRVEVTLNVKPEVAVLQWEAGEAEFITGAPSADLARIRADDTLKSRIRERPSLIFYYLSFANNAKPYDDVRVRQAVAMAIDKVNLAKISQNGVPLDGIFPAGIPQANPDFKTNYPYDPEKAKQLLKDAGVPEGFKTIFWSGGTGKTLGEVIQADLKAVGLDPELLVLEGSSLDVYQDRINNAELPMMTWGFGSDYPDGAAFVASRLLCGSSPYKVSFCDTKIAELAKQADGLPLTDAKRTDALRQIEQIAVNEQVHMVPLYARSALILSQDYVRGDTPDPLLTLPVAEDVWFDR